ncbi:hypothetical protein DIPPA_34817 [Diplonema papillatum]|nr:hypothetical protein DIPPA_34817 [Diplonema papillatum]
MSDDDKEYLRKHNIHRLLDTLARDIISSRPDNPQQYVVEWLKQKEEQEESGGGGGGGAVEDRKKNGIQVTIPDTPLQIGPRQLAELLLKSGGATLVVDVRERQAGGSVKGSEWMPLQDFLKDVPSRASAWAHRSFIVFVSAESPDQDQIAATAYLPVTNEAGNDTEVYTLIGGLRQWMAEYGSDEALTEGYDSDLWKRDAANEDHLQNASGERN